MRTSDFINTHINEVMEAGMIQFNLDEDNVRDLIMSRDLTLNAHFEISNISCDRRALKEKQAFYLS